MAQVIPMKLCPGRSATEIEKYWYKLPQAGTLGICSHCFHEHLSSTPFAGKFELDYDPSDTSRFCDFDVPRMHAVLRQAREQNNFQVLQDYMVYRNQIKRCKGAGVIVNAEDGVSWFQPSDPNLKGKFGACQACYEDFVVAAGFSQYFGSTALQQPKGEKWECNFAWPFSQRLVENCPDWNQVATYMLHRPRLPRCPGATAADASSRTWCKLRPADLGSLWMCEACFYDAASMTHMEQHVYHPTQPVNMKIQCFANGFPALRVAWDVASRKNDFNIFYRAAQVFVRSPACTKEGIQNGTWYSLNPPCEEFDVCAACYAGIIEATGVGHLLTRKQVVPGQARTCDLNPGMPRARTYYKKLDMAIDCGDEKAFVDYVRRVSHLPLCTLDAPVPNKRWYRHDMFSACPSCWAEAVEGTALESCFFARDELFAGNLKCDFYSPRVRALWRRACETNDLPGFVAFMANRLEIWKQTYPQIQQNLALMRMNATRQSTLFASSLMLTGAGNIASAAAGSPHGHYGNSQIGYGYDTYSGAQGAVQFNQALGLNGSNANIGATILQLEAMWKSVE